MRHPLLLRAGLVLSLAALQAYQVRRADDRSVAAPGRNTSCWTGFTSRAL
jgi:hypothetical protein